jgi:hypothetical protein
MNDTQIKKAGLILQFCQTLGFFVAAIALYVNARSFDVSKIGYTDLHDWNRRQYATQVISKYAEQIASHRAGLNEFLDTNQSYHTDTHRATWFSELILCNKPITAIANNRKKANSTEFICNDQAIKAKDHIFAILNIVEDVSIAALYNVADRKILDDEMKSAILRWDDKLKNFMLAFYDLNKDVPAPEPWSAFKWYSAYLGADDLKRYSELPKTGEMLK